VFGGSRKSRVIMIAKSNHYEEGSIYLIAQFLKEEFLNKIKAIIFSLNYSLSYKSMGYVHTH